MKVWFLSKGKVWFLSQEGERHEDHIPYGIFSSIRAIEKALEALGRFDIAQPNNDKVVYTQWLNGFLSMKFTARCVVVDEFNPKILDT